MTAGLHKLLPDFVGTVIGTVQDPDGHHIGTGDYQMTVRITDGYHIDMESDNRNHRRLPHRYGASS